MSQEVSRIKFINCLQEARYAWEMGDFKTAELRASEASVMASLERKVQELNVNKKPLSDQGQFCAPSA